MSGVPAVSNNDFRLAPWVVAPVAVVLAALIALLATREANETGLPEFELGGELAPAILGITVDGERFNLDDLRGEFVVVNFFQTTCIPCIQEHPELLAFHETYGGEGIASVVSIAFDDSPSAVTEFFDLAGGDWPVIASETAVFAVDYSVIAVPESVLIAPSGEVITKVIGGVTQAALETLIIEWQEVNA